MQEQINKKSLPKPTEMLWSKLSKIIAGKQTAVIASSKQPVSSCH